MDVEIYRASVAILGQSAAICGIGGGRCETEAFFGSYGMTPGGIHRETCSNLQLVISGYKEMHFWSDNKVVDDDDVLIATDKSTGMREEYLPGIKIDTMRGAHSVLKAGPGGGFQWNSGVWHVGESPRQSLSMNIADYSISDSIGFGRLQPWSCSVMGEVPIDWYESYIEILDTFVSPLGAMARLSSLNLSPLGLNLTSGPPNCRSTRVSYVSRVDGVPILWIKTGEGSLIVSSMGASLEIERSRYVIQWLTELTSDTSPVVVRPEIERLAFWLQSCGAATLSYKE
ncbi:hypothetical protein [Nocardia farcinica]|uniref:hypothetical protein n=1 Tax=Nocardia farcinica TaxID=37329 RepID=UPI00245589AA|nr:hypothetical protein [Nocardia farcinica]